MEGLVPERWRLYIHHRVQEARARGVDSVQRKFDLAQRVFSNLTKTTLLLSDSQLAIRNSDEKILLLDPLYQRLLGIYSNLTPAEHEIGVELLELCAKLKGRVMPEEQYNHLLNSPYQKLISELYQKGRAILKS